jgi:hypothetical protein
MVTDRMFASTLVTDVKVGIVSPLSICLFACAGSEGTTLGMGDRRHATRCAQALPRRTAVLLSLRVVNLVYH